MYCNGANLNGSFMEKVLDAGIDFIRFSIIGYNKEKYKEWMNIDNFDLTFKKNIYDVWNTNQLELGDYEPQLKIIRNNT